MNSKAETSMLPIVAFAIIVWLFVGAAVETAIPADTDVGYEGFFFEATTPLGPIFSFIIILFVVWIIVRGAGG